MTFHVEIDFQLVVDSGCLTFEFLLGPLGQTEKLNFEFLFLTIYVVRMLLRRSDRGVPRFGALLVSFHRQPHTFHQFRNI